MSQFQYSPLVHREVKGCQGLSIIIIIYCVRCGPTAGIFSFHFISALHRPSPFSR